MPRKKTKKNKEELKQLLKKLQVLAERGVGGEKATAQAKLEKLLAENGMTEKDLAQESINYYLFSYKYPYKEKLLSQCIYKVLGKDKFQVYKSSGTRNKVGAYCTAAQKVEIELEFEFYSNLFDEEVDLLLAAFISKQDIFPPSVETRVINANNMSDEEFNTYMKTQAYANNMSKRSRPTALIEDLKENK